MTFTFNFSNFFYLAHFFELQQNNIELNYLFSSKVKKFHDISDSLKIHPKIELTYTCFSTQLKILKENSFSIESHTQD